MARGITIDEVTNVLDSTDMNGTEKIPVSSGETDPQVVTTGELKEYINDGVQGEISDLDTIRSGAALGATAYQKPGTGIPSTDLESGVIPDVSGFITNTVDDLVNYYTKIETYSQTEVQQLINAVKQFTYELVLVLPAASASTMNKIYLVPSSDPQTQNIKDEYITLESSGSYSWEQIGSTAIDLSDYVTTTALNTALADYTTSTDLSTLLAGYQTKIDSTHKLDYSLIDNTPTIPDITNCVQKSETAGLIKNDGTVDTSTYITQHQDLSNYIQKSSTSGLVKNDGTIDTSTYLTQHQDISNYIQKSNTAGLVKNDGTIDTSTYLTTAPVTSVNGQTGAVSLIIPTVPSNLVTGKNNEGTDTAYTIKVVDSLPNTTDASTIYLVKGS